MRVLVAGDTILDVYSHGTVERISPEAPVPVFDHSHDNLALGGACNVASNIRSLFRDRRLEIDFFGFYSIDIAHMLSEFHINCIGVPAEVLKKKRIVANNHQLLRIDNFKNYKDDNLSAVLRHKWEQIKFENYDIVVLSDYDKYTLTEKEFNYLADSLVDTPLLVDLKRVRSNMNHFNSKTILKCNQKEYDSNPHIKFLSKNLVVTQGERGYCFPNTKESFPGVKRKGEVIDVVGAGDVFLAGMAVNFLEAKAFDPYAMCAFGNLCAGEKVKHFGTVALKRELI